MQGTSRIAAVALTAILTFVSSGLHGAGEYQGWEPLPAVVEIRFNSDAIGFRVAENGYVPGGPRYFELPRGARDWQRIDAAEFNTRFPDRTLPGMVTLDEPRFNVLSTSDGEHFISTGFRCMEGRYHWAGLRRNGDWMRTYTSDCVNIGAVESTGQWLLLGTSYMAEAGMFYGAQGVIVVNGATGELEKRIGYSDDLYAGGMVRHMRRDPFTDDVWVATLTGLWRITENLDLADKFFFSDAFDVQEGKAVTHLTDTPQADPLAQFVRAMGIRNPGVVYAFLDTRREEYRPHSLMYALGMSNASNWSTPEAQMLLPYFLEAAARANDGDWSGMFIQELLQFPHACTQNAGNPYPDNEASEGARRALLNCFAAAGIEIPPYEPPAAAFGIATASPVKPPLIPVRSTFSAPPREASLRLADGRPAAWTKVHAAWFAWQGDINAAGEYAFTRRCVDFDTVVVGNDGYYRFDARTFRRDGDWVGTENRYAIESDKYQAQSFYRRAPPYFDLPPSRAEPSGGGIDTPAERLALECQADGVQSKLITQLLARVEKQKAAKAGRVAAARAEARRQSEALQRQRTQNLIVAPEISVETVTYDIDDPRVIEYYRKRGLEPPKLPETNPLIEQMRKEKEAAEERRKAQEESE